MMYQKNTDRRPEGKSRNTFHNGDSRLRVDFQSIVADAGGGGV